MQEWNWLIFIIIYCNLSIIILLQNHYNYCNIITRFNRYYYRCKLLIVPMLFFIFIIILQLFNYYLKWVRKFLFLSSTPYPSDCSGVLLRDLVTLATWPGRLNKCQSKMSYEVLAFILAILVSISLIFFAIWNVSMRKPLQCNLLQLSHLFLCCFGQIIAFDDLKTDYKNPVDLCNNLNPVKFAKLFIDKHEIFHRYSAPFS